LVKIFSIEAPGTNMVCTASFSSVNGRPSWMSSMTHGTELVSGDGVSFI
jgi:hypothetical protein